jgi:hypothetical protein
MFTSPSQFNRFTCSYYCKLEIVIASLSDRKRILLTHELLKSLLIYLEFFFCLKYFSATHLRHLFNAIMMHRCILSRRKQSFKFSMQFALAPKKKSCNLWKIMQIVALFWNDVDREDGEEMLSMKFCGTGWSCRDWNEVLGRWWWTLILGKAKEWIEKKSHLWQSNSVEFDPEKVPANVFSL